MKPYTYLVKFLPTGQCYYGFRHANVKLKRTAEDDLMKKYFTSSKYIQAMIKEHGIENFSWEVRRKFDTPSEAVAWEKKVLRRCDVLAHQDKWLNKNIAGHILATEESAKKISEFHKGKPKTEEHCEKIRLANKGKHKGPQTAEHRLKNSIANSGVNNPMYGVPCSNERAAKIGAANKGKTNGKGHSWTEEQKQAQREKMIGRKMTPEQVAKSALARTGLTRSIETREKMAASATGKPKGPMSEEGKIARSVALKGRSKSAESSTKKSETLKALAESGKHHSQIVKVCPHCGVEAKTMTYARWHGNNCKMKGQ